MNILYLGSVCCSFAFFLLQAPYLTILSPLLTFGTSIVSFKETSRYFYRFPGLEVITYIDLILSIGLMAFSVYAGIALWSIKKDAVKIAKTYYSPFLDIQLLQAYFPLWPAFPHRLIAL